MIKNNRIIFGFGDIGVGSVKGGGFIDFTDIKPPQEIGSNILNRDDIEFGKTVRIYENIPFEFANLIETINENNTVVEYKGYILDFSNYNQNSVEVVFKSAKHMVNTITLAC